MEWVEWLLSREFRQFVLDHGLFVHILFFARLVGVTAIELIAPARTISYRSVMAYDLIGCTLVGFILVPAAEFLSARVALRAPVPEAIMALPVAATFFLYYLVGDFGAYWLHRLMHLKAVWGVLLEDGVIHIYQASNGQLVKTLTGPSDLSKLAFSLDGELLAASYGESTWLWGLSDGQVLQQLYGKGGSYNGLYFSEDGQVLYSISENMRIWRVKDGKQLINLPNQSFPELSPDGLRLATNDNYETRLWDLTQQKQLL